MCRTAMITMIMRMANTDMTIRTTGTTMRMHTTMATTATTPCATARMCPTTDSHFTGLP